MMHLVIVCKAERNGSTQQHVNVTENCASKPRDIDDCTVECVPVNLEQEGQRGYGST